MMTVERARELRALIEQAAESLDDRAASSGAELFPRLKGDGSLVPAGTRICWARRDPDYSGGHHSGARLCQGRARLVGGRAVCVPG